MLFSVSGDGCSRVAILRVQVRSRAYRGCLGRSGMHAHERRRRRERFRTREVLLRQLRRCLQITTHIDVDAHCGKASQAIAVL